MPSINKINQQESQSSASTQQQGNNNNHPNQGKNNNPWTNFPYSFCGEYGHYTHHFPQISNYKHLKDAQFQNRDNPPQGTSTNWQKHPPPQYVALKNTFPKQGVVAHQQEAPTSSQTSGPILQNVYMNSSMVNLQTHNQAYGMLETTPTEHADTLTSTNGPLQILFPIDDPIPHMPKVPL